MSHACSSQSIGLVTAYDTLGESGVEHSLLQSEAKAMYLDPHLLKTATGPLKKAGSVKIAIYNDSSTFEVPSKVIDEFKAAHPELTILSFEELRALGEKNSADPIPPKPDDLYCIMYTSGTGGLPKGVPVTHAGLVASVAGVHACVQECVTQADFILAYLPLAHIFEMMMENLVLFVGATLGYGNPRTLADSSMRNCPGDMRAFRPTILVGVPQIYETIKKGIISRVDGSGLLTRNLFWGAFNLKTFLVRHGLPLQGALDGVVFGKVRASTGGRLRFLMNGASGISADTQYFLSLVVGPMINGYGLTETCGTGALGSPLQWTSSAVGPIPAAVEVKLVSLPELGYSTARDPPQGEILIRGLPVAREYYRNAEETAKAWTADGWFRTGDVGEFDAEGHMRVVDRVKNLVKMQGGEYVALEKLEAVYRSAAVVQAVMVEASAEYPRAVAVVSPNEKVLAGMAAALSVDEHNARHDKSVNAAVLKELLAHGRKAGLSGMEMVAGVLVVEEEWTPASVSFLFPNAIYAAAPLLCNLPPSLAWPPRITDMYNDVGLSNIHAKAQQASDSGPVEEGYSTNLRDYPIEMCLVGIKMS